MKFLKAAVLAVALEASACAPAQNPDKSETRNENAQEVRDICATTENGSLRCIGYDNNGTESSAFIVDCPKEAVPANSGGFYDDTNNTKHPSGKPLSNPEIKKKLEDAEGGVSCEPSGL